MAAKPEIEAAPATIMENWATEVEGGEAEPAFQAAPAAAPAEWSAEVETWEQEGGGATAPAENQWGGGGQW